MRFFRKRNARSHRKTNRRGLRVVSRQRRIPAAGHASDTLPMLPPGAMKQRTIEMPLVPSRTAYPQPPTRTELAEAANRLTGSFSGHFRLAGDQPLFRGDDMTWAQFDERRLERLRRIQELPKTWADPHGVNFGEHHGPKTLVFSTAGYPRFSDGTGSIPAVKR